MNANAFRHFYEYHFEQNRKIWETFVASLTQEQFTHRVDYSFGSVRDMVIHMMSADEVWFDELRGAETVPFPPESFDDRQLIRARWDSIEQMMRGYLAGLQDEMLFTQPIREPDEDEELYVWQVLLHVVNHGTDHRAQLLRFLNDLGFETSFQDYIFYTYGHPVGGVED